MKLRFLCSALFLAPALLSGQDKGTGFPFPAYTELKQYLTLTDAHVPATTRTSAWQLLQADLNYPGSALSSVHGSAIKRINGWREGPPLVSLPSSIRRLGLHPPVTDQCRTKKE